MRLGPRTWEEMPYIHTGRPRDGRDPMRVPHVHAHQATYLITNAYLQYLSPPRCARGADDLIINELQLLLLNHPFPY